MAEGDPSRGRRCASRPGRSRSQFPVDNTNLLVDRHCDRGAICSCFAITATGDDKKKKKKNHLNGEQSMVTTLFIALACLALGAVAAVPCFILAIRWGLIGPPPPGDMA